MNGLSVCSSEMVGKLVGALTNKSSPIIIIVTDDFQSHQQDKDRYHTVFVLNDEAIDNVLALVDAELKGKDYFVSVKERGEESIWQ